MSCDSYPQENPTRYYAKKCRMHFAPSTLRQEAECARVDFPCSSLEQDLRKGKMMTMTIYPPQRDFLYCSTGAASATFFKPCSIRLNFNNSISLSQISCLNKALSCMPIQFVILPWIHNFCFFVMH